jgi:hypothetical protein
MKPALNEMKPDFHYVLGWWNPGFTTLRPAPGARIAMLAIPVLQKSGSMQTSETYMIGWHARAISRAIPPC